MSIRVATFRLVVDGHFCRAALLAGVSALALAALPAVAQNSARATSMPNLTTLGEAPGGMATTGDGALMSDLAHAHIDEIESAKLALARSKNAQVQEFAQKMMDEHSAAQAQLETLAKAKGVKLPAKTYLMQKSTAAMLKVMRGKTFDNQYLKHAGINAHKNTLVLLQRVSLEAVEPELKALGASMRPMIEQHLKMAQQLQASLKSGAHK
ncbi:MAG: DUF4142 domain-containing protein [Polaromonas sp.]